MKRASIAALLVLAACDSSPSKKQPAPAPGAQRGDPGATTVVMEPADNAAATTVVMPADGVPGGGPPPPAPPTRSDNVVVDAPQIDGSIDPDALRQVVRRRVDVLRDCYEGAARSEPSIEGELAVSFTVGKTGHPSKLAVTGSLAGNEPLATCVTGVFQGLELPAPAADTAQVTVPLGFGPIR